MFAYDRELREYDTVDKLKTLAYAMDLDPEYELRAYTMLRLLQIDGTFEKIGAEKFSEAEIIELEVDVLRNYIWNEMEVRREKRKLEKLIFPDKSNVKSYFVTIGLDDKQFNDKNEADIINPLVQKICNTAGFDNVNFVVEKYRKNESGQIYIHRHIHFVLDSNLKKSKVIQFCFQKARKYIAGQNFIDVKPDNGRTREKYIKGQKIDSKMECVEKDREWRTAYKIIEN